MSRQKRLKAFDWIALAALVASVAFRLITKFLKLDGAAYDASDIASEMLTMVCVVWLFVRAMQSVTPPSYESRRNKTP